MYFDEKLKALREKAGLSISELAEKLDISESIMEALETGFKDPDKIEMRKITEFYKVTEDDLQDDEPYVNAFATLFANSEPGVNPLALPMAFAAGMVNQKAEQNDTEIKKIPFVQKISLENDDLSILPSDKYLLADNITGNNLIAFRISDDNMQYMGILPGDAAIAEITQEVKPEHIAIILRQDNLSLASAMSIEEADIIIGRIVELRRSF